MTVEAARLLAMAIAIGLGSAGAGIGIGIVSGKGVEAIGRNPETENAVRNNMIIGIVFAETTMLFAFLITLIIRFVK